MHLGYLGNDHGAGGCAELYRVLDNGGDGRVIQGRTLPDDTRTALREITADEDAAFLPAKVPNRLAALLARP